MWRRQTLVAVSVLQIQLLIVTVLTTPSNIAPFNVIISHYGFQMENMIQILTGRPPNESSYATATELAILEEWDAMIDRFPLDEVDKADERPLFSD